MSIIIILIVIIPVLVGIGITTAALNRRVQSHDALLSLIGGDYPDFPRMVKSARTVRIGAFVLAILNIPLMGQFGAFGRGLGLAPLVAGFILIAGSIVHSRRFHRAAQKQGISALERRTVMDYVNRRSLVLVATSLVMFVAVMLIATFIASADETGHLRGFAYTCGQGITGFRGPFPGSYYTIPITGACLIVLLLALVALWLNARRPRNGADSMLVRLDDVVRKSTGESVLGALGVALSLTTLGISYFAAIGTMATCPITGSALGTQVVSPSLPIGFAIAGALSGIVACVSAVSYLAPRIAVDELVHEVRL